MKKRLNVLTIDMSDQRLVIDVDEVNMRVAVERHGESFLQGLREVLDMAEAMYENEEI